MLSLHACCALVFCGLGQPFVNFETPHVHPLDITPDGKTLLAVNTADNRLEIFDVSGGVPVSTGSVPVGLDPVSVRAMGNAQAWVVNHISDSVSVVHIPSRRVIATLLTDDEPCDVVFAGTPTKAFVSCSQANTVNVFVVNDLTVEPTVIPIEGEDPRAMAVNADGTRIFVGIFESGNQTTVLGVHSQGDVVSRPEGPYGGQNPPPNDGLDFKPPLDPELPLPADLGLIVRNDGTGRWLDDNGGDWTNYVSGEDARLTSRVIGWELIDHDVAIIDTASLSVINYFSGMMNLCMALSIGPADRVTVVGTEATNEIRFEPNLKGRFVRVRVASASELSPTPTVLDLNPHLDYTDAQIAAQSDPLTADQGLRELSIGDPRAIVWNSVKTRGYIAGMGSNNVLAINGAGTRVANPIRVGQGPTGLALSADESKLYVLNKFDGTISVLDTAGLLEIARVAYFDPTPQAIKLGRPFQYDTQQTSGLGQVACASCHVDARMDRLGWDLGDPSGEIVAFDEEGNCSFGAGNEGICRDYSPYKGVMTTQTLQDIIGHEPFHWRGDRKTLKHFNIAFTGLQGDDTMPTDAEMDLYRDFLATIALPPNPYRNLDNSLPTDLPLTEHFSMGLFEGGLELGEQLPNGDAVAGLNDYRTVVFHEAGPGAGVATCVLCHSLPTGLGAEVRFTGDAECYPDPDCGTFEELVVGPEGEHHVMITSVTDFTMKVPQLRNLYDKVGYEGTQSKSRAGFGFFHDGGNSLSQFLSPFEGMTSDQQAANIIAFVLSFSGSELPHGSLDNLVEPPGPLGKDVHAAVGQQVTITAANKNDAGVLDRLATFVSEADDNDLVSLVVKGIRGGAQRGWCYVGGGLLQSDLAGEIAVLDELREGTVVEQEITVTVVPMGSQVRIGIDRDEDGCLDRDEILGGSSPTDPQSLAPSCRCLADTNGDGTVDPLDAGFVQARFGCVVNAGDAECDAADANADRVVDPLDVGFVLARFGACS